MSTNESLRLPDPATASAVDLTAAMVDIYSVSDHETHLADEVERHLRAMGHLTVVREGDAILARTNAGRAQRVIIAGHLDTVPVANNIPHRREVIDGDDAIWGRGSVDMKSGCAVQLALAAELTDPAIDVTWVFYDHEEVDTDRSGLKRLLDMHPDLTRDADFGILTEPTSAAIEGGCNGTLRIRVDVTGRAAHSARHWMGHNAIHAAAAILQRLADYEPRTVTVDGLDYRESLSIVKIEGGIANNVIPDHCRIWINYRYAPDSDAAAALDRLRALLDGAGGTITFEDAADGARPGLTEPLAASFVRAAQRYAGASVGPKYGWTDVARLAAAGIPAVNFGPGDPALAHTDEENCPISHIEACHAALRAWLRQDGAHGTS
ncbi:succinyl-diaminopimelate desuccinylase [Bowdeniella nasicola]|uniref:Succinyl-diaminopimelate desuccinylase n=1 Tax=Bowdeniella nasicola TaxID=208480 RepID=A0A1Q5Q0R9_9ACTO|nr:succinyl-diaminopimelate desuccinylase [Bowdeniella nasicola]OKL53444.1 succinyl-diaminopimelate desuccinylase [Bowdeniella nasicola]